MQQLRYEGSRLDDVLARIGVDHGPDANIVTADMVRTGGFGGFFSRENYQVVVELIDPIPLDPDQEPLDDDDVPEADAGRDFADLLAALVDDSVDLTGATSPLDAKRTSRSAPPATVTTRRPLARPLAQPVSSLSSSDLVREDVIELPDARDDGAFGNDSGLIDLALMHRNVSATFRPAPSIADCGIVAMIGARRDAIAAAVGVAELLGRSGSDVLVLEPDKNDNGKGPSPEELVAIVRSAARQRERLGVAGPTFVVVVVAPGVDGHRWATSVLAGLQADQVRLAVAGWRSLPRLPETIVGLGGVDVIDVVDLQSADDAAAFLDLDTPIGTVDGELATPAGWVAALAALGQPLMRPNGGIGLHETTNR